jgi:DNA repair exonuclease SbcCD ATPase subunit
MKIAHLADIQIRFGSRHEEYRQVFKRTYSDLEKQKPDRICVVGDINHHKINISPGSLDISSEFLINLSRIAPTDVFLGNHDINLQQLEQGDSISPIFNLAKLLHKEDSDAQIAYIVSKENKDSIDFSKNAIYYYPDSGFYNIAKDLIYGVYSCKDDIILTLDKKDHNKHYIGFYHGTVYGARGDNGHEMKGDKLMRLSTFNNFDAVLLGDIHEYQSFRDDEAVAYCGSLIQQNYGESIDKGYLIWDINKNGATHKRRYILNDYGFAKLTVSKGEILEERIEHIKFSNNKRKTKVHIVWEDNEENYSIERENQIKKLIKDKYGCEVVRVQFQGIVKNNSLKLEDAEADTNNIKNYLLEFIKNNNFDCDDVMLKEVLTFSEEVDKALEITEGSTERSEWELETMEVSNILSFPEQPVFFDFNSLARKLVGIFGSNYSGKSNTIRALAWGLFQSILGGADSKNIINLYTSSNKGYVKIHLIINGVRYYIRRGVTTKVNKAGVKENSYSIEYKMLKIKEDGTEEWVNEISDNKTAEKTEVKKMVIEAIGTADDIAKVSIMNQDSKEDYMNLKQQPKNDLVNKYLNLQPYRDRHEYANKYFLEVQRNQKELGNCMDMEDKIKTYKEEVVIKYAQLQSFNEEKRNVNLKKEDTDVQILELTKTLEKVEKVEIDNIDTLKKRVLEERELLGKENKELSDVKSWLGINFKKELPFEEGQSLSKLETIIKKEQDAFAQEKKEFYEIDIWLKSNSKKQELSQEEVLDTETKTDNLKRVNITLDNELPIHRGKNCPTCGKVEKQANPDLERACLETIKNNKNEIVLLQSKLTDNKSNIQLNNLIEVKSTKLSGLKNSLTSKKYKLEDAKAQRDLFLKSEDIIKHNKEIESNSIKQDTLKYSIESRTKLIEKYIDNAKKINENKSKILHNKSVDDKIEELQELSKAYKISVYNLDKDINVLNGDIRVLDNNIKNLDEKISRVKNIENLYKKYSIYLQAVHRDGIPAQIIRKKLPIINNKINSILADCVNFKLDIKVLVNGDIVEYFYFSPDKSDSLSIESASGAMKFVIGLAIQEAMHYISTFSKPSFKFIDEGFGKLDDRLVSEIPNVLNYLRNKYKNVFFITHRIDIKEYADYMIEVSKNSAGVSKEILANNPDAGTSVFNFS